MNDENLNEQINNIQNEANLLINIKIRTMDNVEFQVNIDTENKIEELKKKIENVFKF
jgi:conjugal transfer/entry exclusion protein